MVGTWLSGPAAARAARQRWRGERLGLPRTGAGSLPSLGRRVGGLTVDWLLSYALVGIGLTLGGIAPLGTNGFGAYASILVPLVWALLGAVCVALFAQTPGQAVLGMGTARVDDSQARVGWWRAAVRSLFLLFLLPPLVQDEDGRGMHDRATGTAVIRTR